VKSVMSRTLSSIRATAIARSVGVSRELLRWLGSAYRSTDSQSLPANRKASDRQSISLASFVPPVERTSTDATVGRPHPEWATASFPLASEHWTTLGWCGHNCTNGGRIGSRGSQIMVICLVSRTAISPTRPHALRMSPNPSLNADVPRVGAAPRAAGRRLACFARRHAAKSSTPASKRSS
jgi:hypothetical protein